MTTVETTPSTMADLLVQHEVEQWLYHEAALLDARDYDAWLGLLSPAIRYFIPLRENRLDRDVSRDKKGTGLETALFDDAAVDRLGGGGSGGLGGGGGEPTDGPRAGLGQDAQGPCVGEGERAGGAGGGIRAAARRRR